MSADRGAAFHEAAHVLVSHVLGRRRCTLVTIIPNEECGGRAEYEPLPEWFAPDVDAGPETQAIIRAEITCLFAGSVAQARIDGATEAEDSSMGDFIKAGGLASYVCGSADMETAYLCSCKAEALRLVVTHWSAIEALADALMQRHTLTGKEAVSIIKGMLGSEAG